MEKENKILIFRTSITRKCDIKRIEKLLAQYPQIDKWNVDFEDWEKILRIECSGITALEISEVLRNNHIFLNHMYRTRSMCIHRLWVNEIHLCFPRYIMK